jgi:hypothetical protein
MIFGEDLELRFRGSVGFDDTVEMWVELPLRARSLLAEGWPLSGYFDVLEKADARVEIPIVGRRLAPRLALDRARLRSHIKKTVDNVRDEILNR